MASGGEADNGRAEARLEGGCVVGTVPPALVHQGEVGVVLDGVLRHAVAVGPAGSFSFPLAGPRTPESFDLEELATGRRLLRTPIPVGALDGFALDELRLNGTVLEGSFSLGWAPHPFLPVAFLSDGTEAARGLAFRAAGTGPPAYRFRLPLHMVPAGPLPVAPVVAGVRRDGFARSLDCAFAGYVDTVAGADVSGWVVDTTRPEQVQRVEVRRGGRVVASASTGRERVDVAQAIPGAGLCGFSVRVPVSERMRGDDEPYQVVLAGTETLLRGGSVRVPAAPPRMGTLDAAAGAILRGWAVDATLPGAATVEARHGGRVLATALANQFRADLQEEQLAAPGLPFGHCGFTLWLSPADAALVGQPIEVWANGFELQGSPRQLEPNPNIARFRTRAARVRPEVLPRLRMMLDRAVARRSLSLVVCALETEPEALAGVLAATTGQWCSRWELLCVHDGFAAPATARVAAQFARRDPRIRLVPAAAPDGAAAFLRTGIAAARSGYVAVLPPDARLQPDAVYQMLRGIRDTGADVLYADTCLLDPGTDEIAGIEAHTAFSADRFRSAPFRPDLLCVRSDLAQAIGAVDGLAFAAEVFARAETVAHIPAVVLARPSTPQRTELAPGVAVESATAEGAGVAEVLVVAEAGSRMPDEVPCRAVAVETADPAALNEAVARNGRGCAAVLFLLGGVAPGADAVRRLLALVARPDVAAAGPVLAGPGGRVAAAGLVLGGPDGAAPALAGAILPADNAVRNVSALPGACLVVRLDAWNTAGGFDEAAGTLFDADLCLRLDAAGRNVLLDGRSVVSVPAPLPMPDGADAARFAARHKTSLLHGDRWYSPFLSDDGSWLLRSDPGCRTVHAARVVTRQPEPLASEPVPRSAPRRAARSRSRKPTNP